MQRYTLYENALQLYLQKLANNILEYLIQPFVLPHTLLLKRIQQGFPFVCRQICVDDGQELSLQYGCQFYEVSAAENFAGVSLAFQSLLREARSVQLLKALPIRRKLGVNSVSKVLGNIFGKNSKGDRKKRPSLSI